MANGSVAVQNRPKTYVRTASGNDCWYVQSYMYERPIQWLVDTGASPNVLDWNTYMDIPTNKRPVLTAVNTNLQAADGTALCVYGETNIEITLHGQTFQVKVIFAALQDIEGILGMSFLSLCACVIDTYHGSLTVQGTKMMLLKQEGPDCCRVRITANVTIPPDTEQVIVGQICKHDWSRQLKIGLAEAINSILPDTGLMTLTCANLTAKPVTMEMGTTVAMLHPIERISSIQDGKMNPTRTYIDKDVIDLPEHLQDMAKRAIEGLLPNQARYICGMIYDNQALFLSPDGEIGRTNLVKHAINTGHAQPIRARPYKPALKQRHIIEEQIEQMLEADQIVPSDSPWSSPVVLVVKKDGSPRFCADYRALNSVTIKDSYPIPNIQDCLDTLSGAKWFSTLDLASGYWQCEVADEDQHKTAFITHKGLFHFKVLPFGLTNAPATFERLMERVLHGLQWERCLIYLDDIISFGNTFHGAAHNLQAVFDRIREAGLILKPKKCDLFQQQVAFLGHIVSSDGVTCDPAKIAAVKEWKTPKLFRICKLL